MNTLTVLARKTFSFSSFKNSNLIPPTPSVEDVQVQVESLNLNSSGPQISSLRAVSGQVVTNDNSEDGHLENVRDNNLAGPSTETPKVDVNVVENEPDQNNVRKDNDMDINVSRTTVTGGIITNLEEGMKDGIVDRFYRFSQKDFGTTFHLGDKVNYLAEQDNESLEWRVKQMSHFVSEAKQQSDENRHYSTHICKVLSIKDQYANVNVPGYKEISIHETQLPKDYEIKVGDFLEVKMKVDENISTNDILNDVLKSRFLSINPSKTKTVVNGTITRNRGFLCVDEHILITPEFLKDKSFPKMGDLVEAKAVESSQDDESFNWRVISISPSKFSKYSAEDAEECEARDSLNAELREYIDKLLDDKCGIIVNPQRRLDFRTTRVGSLVEKVVDIINTSTKMHTLRNVEMRNDQRICKFEVILPRVEGPGLIAVVEPGESVVIKITCQPLLTGRTTELCKFDFGEFCIGRYVYAKSVPLDDSTINALTADRSARNSKQLGTISQEIEKRNETFTKGDRGTVRGVSAVRRPFFLPKVIPHYHYPDSVFNALRDNKAQHLFERYPSLKVTELQETLEITFERYKEMFQVALWFEEIDHQRKRDKHTQCDVTLFRSGDMMYFEVPSLQDFQPPLMVGEGINICNAADDTGKIYKTNVHKISENKVFGKFDVRFQEDYRGTPMTVRFKLGRNTYRRAHYAVENAPTLLGKDWLFPATVDIKTPKFTLIEEGGDDDDLTEEEEDSKDFKNVVLLHRNKPRLRSKIKRPNVLDVRQKNLFPLPTVTEEESHLSLNVKLKWFKDNLNEEQKNAVRRILRGQCRPIPYIIFGPPGTGKTVTVVEAVMQVNKLDKMSRILVTAPSNAAADLIAEYLVASNQYKPGDFVRFIGFQRDPTTIPDTIVDYCSDGSDLQNIARNKIIISTCNNAGQFYLLGITSGHFTHVFLDEAGYCHEPDSIIPALLVSLDSKGQFIMAGDPNQLGPSLICDAAEYYGLEKSFLERLMKMPLYKRDKTTKEFNPLVLTKLLKNYRSHDLLLKLPSRLFYDDELVSAASNHDTEKLCDYLDFLPTRGIPLLFHGIRGDEAKDSDSPSWYNPLEVVEVIGYVKKLMNNGCTADDIGIITPYRKQVEKIRQGIRKDLDCQMPRVGSVQEFQGGERKIIIVSLVRSRDSENKSALPINKFEFLFAPKRFNVSVTRAKEVLIVVGNPHLFYKNPVWCKFLEYCIELEAYIGCDIPNVLNEKLLKKALVKPVSPNRSSLVDHESLPSNEDYFSESD